MSSLLRLSLFFWQMGLMSLPASQFGEGYNKGRAWKVWVLLFLFTQPHLWGLSNPGEGWDVELHRPYRKGS